MTTTTTDELAGVKSVRCVWKHPVTAEQYAKIAQFILEAHDAGFTCVRTDNGRQVAVKAVRPDTSAPERAGA